MNGRWDRVELLGIVGIVRTAAQNGLNFLRHLDLGQSLGTGAKTGDSVRHPSPKGFLLNSPGLFGAERGELITFGGHHLL